MSCPQRQVEPEVRVPDLVDEPGSPGDDGDMLPGCVALGEGLGQNLLAGDDLAAVPQHGLFPTTNHRVRRAVQEPSELALVFLGEVLHHCRVARALDPAELTLPKDCETSGLDLVREQGVHIAHGVDLHRPDDTGLTAEPLKLRDELRDLVLRGTHTHQLRVDHLLGLLDPLAGLDRLDHVVEELGHLGQGTVVEQDPTESRPLHVDGTRCRVHRVPREVRHRWLGDIVLREVVRDPLRLLPDLGQVLARDRQRAVGIAEGVVQGDSPDVSEPLTEVQKVRLDRQELCLLALDGRQLGNTEPLQLCR